MEAIKGYITEVEFTVPSDLLAAQFKVFRNGVQEGLTANATISDGVATATLPYSATLIEDEISVQLTFTYQSQPVILTRNVQIITPILEAREVKKIIGATATDEEAFAAEASARYIIQAYTGQSYGSFTGAISVTGNGDSTLRLPRRLISLDSINDNTVLPEWVSLRGGGWFLVSQMVGAPTVRADFDGWHQNPWSGVITPPPRWARNLVGFGYGLEFIINGKWGWDDVPPAVVEAAKLLINDYACGDSLYRDRFIETITGPDWQMQFNDGAYTSTGNVRADQLLADYKLRRGWMVI
jgi:hypothetical protein